MRNIFIFCLLAQLLFSCNSNEKKVVEESYPDGTPKIEKYYKINDSDSEMVREIQYYDNEQIYIKGDYKNEKRDGDWISYYPNGKIWSEGTFENGLSEGKSTAYYENGEKSQEGYFSKGKATGIWKFWDKNGKLKETIDMDTVKLK